jgi:uncharacterized membrane protein (UPF0127 family)
MPHVKKATLVNHTRPTSQVVQAACRPDFWGKFLGLMFRKNFQGDAGIILDQKKDSRIDSSIHMFFMNFDIAVIWVNHDMRVVDACLAKRWNGVYAPKAPARYVIELPVKFLDHFLPGDQIEFCYE